MRTTDQVSFLSKATLTAECISYKIPYFFRFLQCILLQISLHIAVDFRVLFHSFAVNTPAQIARKKATKSKMLNF